MGFKHGVKANLVLLYSDFLDVKLGPEPGEAGEGETLCGGKACRWNVEVVIVS